MASYTHAQVVRFVSSYMAAVRRHEVRRPDSRGNLPLEIAKAFVSANGLPDSEIARLIPLIDNVL